MNPEPLKGKKRKDELEWYNFAFDDVKSAVTGLIQFHEDRIKKLKTLIKESEGELKIRRQLLLDDEKEAIMAIEHWLEDVI